MNIDWDQFKSIVDDRGVSIQYVDHSDTYHMWIVDGLFQVECKIKKDSSSDQSDFEDNYKDFANRPIGERGTLQLVKLKASTVSGVATALLKIPGDPGTKDSRVISGGIGWFNSHHADDYAEVYLSDEDNILGMGAGTVVGSYTETDAEPENVGVYFTPQGILNIEAIGGMGRLVGGLYLKIIATKGDLSSDTFRCNIFWGVKS